MTYSVPAGLDEFRQTLAARFREAGHSPLAEHLEDVGMEDVIAAPVLQAWDFIREEERLAKSSEFWSDYHDVIHDAVIDIEAEYSNRMNHAPGVRLVRADGARLAASVCKALESGAKAACVVSDGA